MTDKQVAFGRPILGDAEKALVADVLSGHMLTHGPKCKAFEEKFAARTGAKHAITTSNCTTAMQIALMTKGIGPGDEVIVPAMTHVATAHCVEHLGARPRFVDVDPVTGNIDAEKIEAAINAKTKAIMVVHYLGLACDMDRIVAIAEAHGLPLIEDSATGLGTYYDGRHAGTFGMAGCFSFYPTKHMTTLEGGMLITNDDEVAGLAQNLRAFGYDKMLGDRSEPGVYDIIRLGHNFRMSEAHAAVGLCQLDRLDGFLAARQRNSDILSKRLQGLDAITLFPLSHGKAESGRYCFNITLKQDAGLVRRDINAALNERGVGTSVHYPVALPLSNYYRGRYGHQPEEFPVANWIATHTISLPCGPHLEDGDADFIADQVLDVFSGDAP